MKVFDEGKDVLDPLFQIEVIMLPNTIDIQRWWLKPFSIETALGKRCIHGVQLDLFAGFSDREVVPRGSSCV